ncbi:mechanosensitive ion channel family protein [Acetonema longum]|uniref:MscS Mechanosensitive ion channel n=1 Tax=Acetonema longum DSM 6540 TaxID=1009370 RepID=F7NE66_9FIRM|nr:mechanosensitive ion channel family protein [Acetonema longum]EGO65721.1 MscS Mechanosensitive ion channel [Acetonema longum DSM 6540]
MLNEAAALFSPAILWSAGTTLLRVTAIFAGAVLAFRFFDIIVDRLFGKTTYLEEKRARTLSSLLKSLIHYLVYFIALVMILQEFAIDTTSIIAGAGIIGLAIGFGAQSLVRDVISGFFIIMEDQYAVGDYITSGDMSGTVHEIGFRVTKLRDTVGTLHIIPNGSITRVSNFSRGPMQAAVNIPVSYQADVKQVWRLLQEVCDDVGTMPQVLEQPKIVGIIDLRPAEMLIRVTARTRPLEQGAVETQIRRQALEKFKQAQIPPPVSWPADFKVQGVSQ